MLQTTILINKGTSNYFIKILLTKNLLSPLINFTDRKKFKLFQVIGFGLQVDHINPKKTQLIEEYSGATNNARLLVILIRRKEIEMKLKWK